MAKKLAELPIGESVYLNVEGKRTGFIVVHQGLPSSLYSETCNGTWLLAADIYTVKFFDSTGQNDYDLSEMYSYLNDDFLGLLDRNMQYDLRTAKLPWKKGDEIKNGDEGIPSKVFLLSATEVNMQLSFVDDIGSPLDYFSESEDTVATTNRRVAYYQGSAKSWWLRSPSSTILMDCVAADGGWLANSVSGYTCGVRPAFILNSDLSVSDDGDVVPVEPPRRPFGLQVPVLYGGREAKLEWDSHYVDEKTAGYILQRNVDRTTFVQIYKGEERSYTDTISNYWKTVQYRVCAYDKRGALSEFTYPAIQTSGVIANSTPTISGLNADLGEKNKGFEIEYVILDADGDEVSVEELLDGEIIRSYVAVLGEKNTFSITRKVWSQIKNNSSHKLTIRVSDEIGNMAIREYTFIKFVRFFVKKNYLRYKLALITMTADEASISNGKIASRTKNKVDVHSCPSLYKLSHLGDLDSKLVSEIDDETLSKLDYKKIML